MQLKRYLTVLYVQSTFLHIRLLQHIHVLQVMTIFRRVYTNTGSSASLKLQLSHNRTVSSTAELQI